MKYEYTSEPEIPVLLSNRLLRLLIVTVPSRLEVGHSILLPTAELLTLVLQVFPIQLQYFLMVLPIFKQKTQALKCPVDLFVLRHSHYS